MFAVGKFIFVTNKKLCEDARMGILQMMIKNDRLT